MGEVSAPESLELPRQWAVSNKQYYYQLKLVKHWHSITAKNLLKKIMESYEGVNMKNLNIVSIQHEQ